MRQKEIESRIEQLKKEQAQIKHGADANIALLEQQKQAQIGAYDQRKEQVAAEANIEVGKILGRIEDLTTELSELVKAEAAKSVAQ